MSGTLYVVATPIGNLEDITLRALRILREVDVIAAEDTRHTAKLLRHYGISTSTISFHEHNTRGRIPQFIGRLKKGESIALVSDAGTPGVSDPGLDLIRACIEAGVALDPIPGPSAVLAALAVAGFPTEPMSYFGFPPTRPNARLTWITAVSDVAHTVVFFEAPHRLTATLKQAAPVWGNRPLALARELTKLHQELIRGTAADLGEQQIVPRGEYTVVVGPATRDAADVDALPADVSIVDEFRQITESGHLSRRAAISQLSRKYRRPSREIYARLEMAKKSLP